MMEYHHHHHYDPIASKDDKGEEETALLESGKEPEEAAETGALMMTSGRHSSIRTAHHQYRQKPAPLLTRWRKSHSVHCVLNLFLTAVLLCSIVFVWLRDAATKRQSTSPDVEHYHYYCMFVGKWFPPPSEYLTYGSSPLRSFLLAHSK